VAAAEYGSGAGEMSVSAHKPATPALALSVEQACAALGVSWDFWREHVEADIRIVRIGRRKLIAVSELQRWLDENGETVGRANTTTKGTPQCG
jgi:excisionase family DNA binding protein